MAIKSVLRLIAFSLLIAINVCNDGLEVTQRHEQTIVSLPTSLSTQSSLDHYSSDSNCRRRLLSSDDKPELLIISTLDGKLSALDVTSGEELWSKSLTTEPLVSSTISNFEIIRNGHMVRVVPSLDGNLYLFDGKTIDEIPLNAEILLKSSFKLGDDLVITGGQESQISGIEISSGRIHYECGINGCPSAQINENETFDDLFLVKQNKQTVRAIDPRNGRQKWHFSVTEPEISEAITPGCDETDGFDNQSEDNPKIISDNTLKETDIQVIVPNGVVSAQRQASGDSQGFEWSHRFNSPIVQVWHYRSGQIDSMNLFDKSKLFGLTNTELKGYEPTIYIGLFQNQWYVQTPDALKNAITGFEVTKNNMLTSATKKRLDSKTNNILQIEWKPLAVDKDSNYLKDEKLKFISNPQFSLSISSNDNKNQGFYILDTIEDNNTKCIARERNLSNSQEWEEEEEAFYGQNYIVITSLTDYWREVTAISIVSAIVLNFIYSFIKRKVSEKVEEIDRIMNPEKSNDSLAKGDGPPTPDLTPQPCDSVNPENNYFSSRYESDFDPIQVLGKGGFGLVFEAKHKIDESHYAVKRICLPIRKEQKEKVMREVRALSKLDHSGIVRYYNAWVELPPPGWQETKDKHWLPEDMTKSHLMNESLLSDKPVANTKWSIHDLRSNETSTEMSFSFVNSKQKYSETQSNQSLDIVFDENVSSIRMMETNNCQMKSRELSSISEMSVTSNHKKSISSMITTDNNNSVKSADRRPTTLPTSIPRCYLYIQMQLCRKETLKDWLFANSRHRDTNTVLDIFDQIVSAVHYVHSMGLMHRDLKPSNIFFSMDGNIKIGDFGLVTATAADAEDAHTPGADEDCDDSPTFIKNQSSSSHTNCVGTQLYMSPEQVRNLPYSQKVDIFSMGIILFELLIPFNTEMERMLLLKNARKRIFPKEFSDKYVSEYDLLKKLLSQNPDKRPSTLDIKEHPMLQNLQPMSSVPRQRSRTISMNSEDFI